jgi:phytanoyl-CoA hydroxylase
MEFAEYRADFDRDGFVVVPEFLTGDDLTEVTGHLDRYIREVVPTLPDSDAFYDDKSRPETLKQLQHMGRDPFFEGYRQHPRWTALAAALLNEPVDPQVPEWFNKPPGTTNPTPPHQDNYYFNLKPPNTVSLWLALDRVDEGNGCLRYVAGSHRRGRRPHAVTSVLGFSQGITDYGPEDESREVAIKLEPGDVAAHHCEAIHRADPNSSPTRSRRAFAMVIHGKSCCLDEEASRRYVVAARKQHESMGLQPGTVQGVLADEV